MIKHDHRLFRFVGVDCVFLGATGLRLRRDESRLYSTGVRGGRMPFYRRILGIHRLLHAHYGAIPLFCQAKKAHHL